MSGFKICAIFFRDGEEETVRNASCFVISFTVNNKLQKFKVVSKSNHVLVQWSLPNLNIKILYSAYKKTRNMVNLMTSERDRTWCETTPI